MAYDHSEEEQLAEVKAWWSRNGSWISWALIALLAAYAGWAGWNYYQRSQSSQAAQLYEEFQKAVNAKEIARVQRAASDIQQKFGASIYAQMSALSAAKVAFDNNDLAAAKTQLQWLVSNGRDDEFKSIAKIRLAGLLLDEKSYDAALQLLTGNFPKPFTALVAERRGDVLVGQNKLPEARTAYQTAIDQTELKTPGRQLMQLKLDAIGGAPAKAAA